MVKLHHISQLDDWRSLLMDSGELYVMTVLDMQRQLPFVDSLGFQATSNMEVLEALH